MSKILKAEDVEAARSADRPEKAPAAERAKGKPAWSDLRGLLSREDGEELARIIEDHKASVAEQHESHIAAEEFIRELAGLPAGECKECG